jgi:hypothetical protein
MVPLYSYMYSAKGDLLMRRSLMYRLGASLFTAVIVALCASPAFADDFGKRFTIDVGPVFDGTTTGDANAPAPPGQIGVGYTKDNPIPNDIRVEGGLDYRIDAKTHFYYTRGYLDFAIGRILSTGPGVALVSGLIADRTDTIGINRAIGKGLIGRLYYYDHERSDVSGLCLNQISCPNAAGVQSGNPGSIDEHGYGAGFSYNFGPMTRIGPLFTAGFDAKYVPRTGTPPTPCGSCEGIGHYVGSQFLLPYSLTMKIPVLPSHTVIPFVGYERAEVLFRNETTPEMFNVTDFGLVKVVNKNVVLSITNLNFAGCRCSNVVPPPDNVRFAEVLLKVDFKTSL